MPLYVKDEEVNQLVEEARKALGMVSKTETVRVAMERVLREQRDKRPLRERLREVQAATMALGTPAPDFDDKKFFDEMWGHE